MYVCLCLGVSDREIREAVGGGACTVAEVMQRTGAGMGCGSCRTTIASLVGGAEEPRVACRRLELVRTPTAA